MVFSVRLLLTWFAVTVQPHLITHLLLFVFVIF